MTVHGDSLQRNFKVYSTGDRQPVKFSLQFMAWSLTFADIAYDSGQIVLNSLQFVQQSRSGTVQQSITIVNAAAYNAEPDCTSNIS